jgi:hypothetical protein
VIGVVVEIVWVDCLRGDEDAGVAGVLSEDGLFGGPPPHCDMNDRTVNVEEKN